MFCYFSGILPPFHVLSYSFLENLFFKYCSNWQREKTRIKVWTRDMNNIRGFCTGFISAFDKHWNLALRDVDENFNRPRSRKTYSSSTMKSILMPQDLPVEMKIGSSLLRVIKIENKFEVCVRHVPQVLLRGEHVVMISKLS